MRAPQATRHLHAPLWDGMQRSLVDIFEGGFLADKVIQKRFKENRKWGSHDRRLFAEGVYDCVRWWRKLLYVVEVPWPKNELWAKADPEVYAAVVQAWCILNDVELDKRIVPVDLQPGAIRAVWKDSTLPRAVRQSLPDWLDAYGAVQLGPRWEPILSVLNSTAPVYLRTNRLLTTPEKLVPALELEKVFAKAVQADTLVLERRANVHLTPSFRSGHFEVQDLNSQNVALWMAPKAGERIVDACAGGGGKSLHLAALMGNKGKIIAMDVVEKKLEELRLRATRARATCIETRTIDSTKVIKRLADSADRVLLDVPCTGLGVLRRNPDAKWRLSRAGIERVKTLQREILASYPQMVKVGGTLVYSTCSILPEENEKQIAEFLSRSGANTEGGPKWELEKQETLWPANNGPDGFYLARLKRLA